MARRTRRNVGIIGLGIIGSRVADNLRRKGIPVFVWNRTPKPVPNFVGSPIELAELCDLIQLFVADDDAVLEMVQRMKSALTKQHVVIISSTVSPDTVRAAAEIVERRGGRVVDAPFTGSKGAAASGELVYYVGGDSAAIEEVRPVLDGSGKEVIEIGGVGQASAMKVATNIVTAATVQAAAEALALIVDSGIAPDKLVAAMRSNGSNSKTLDMKLPKMIEGDLEPHFSVKHMLKDMAIASRAARSFGLDFAAADAARLALQAEERAGRGDADYSAIVRNYFPHDGPLQREQPAPELPDEHPTFASLESRGPAQMPQHMERMTVPEQRPEPVAISEAPVTQPVAEPNNGAASAAPMFAEETAGVSGTSEVEEPQPAAVPENEPAEPPTASPEAQPAMAETGSGSGLFRRFVRRGADF